MAIRTPRPSVSAPSTEDDASRPPTRSEGDSARKPHPGWNAILAVAVGLTLAVLLPFTPLAPATESGVTGAALLGLAVGWLLLGLLARRSSGQWQGWALAAVVFFAVSGLLLITLGAPAHRVLDWGWPPALLALGVWVLAAVRRRRGMLSRGVLYPVAALLVLASTGGGIETVAEAADAAAHPVPGRLIDVGGHRLHLRCTGTGSPTVVFESGGGDASSSAGPVTTAVARTTRICAYDRAGRGWSEPAATPPAGAQIAIDLHTLLHRGGVPGPYVLAGHSFGGLYVRNFALRYPDEVAGMVLVDSTAPNASARGVGGTAGLMHRGAALLSVSARFGLLRVVEALTGEGLPSPFEEEVRASGARAGDLESTLDEYADAAEASGSAAGLTSIGDKPLVVLTAVVGNPPSWFAAQRRMTALSTDSVHRRVPNSDHEGMVRGPQGSAATARGILDVVTSVRSGQPLTAG